MFGCDLYISDKTAERKEMEASRLHAILIQIAEGKSILIPTYYFGEIITGCKVVINNSEVEIAASEILKDGNRIQLFTTDYNSPFGKRKLIVHFGSSQDTKPVTKEYLFSIIAFSWDNLTTTFNNLDENLCFEGKLTVDELTVIGLLPKDDSELERYLHQLNLYIPNKIYPDSKNERDKFDEIRKKEWDQFLQLCNQQADISNQLVTISSGVSYVNSIAYALHAQSIELKEGIEILGNYDPDKLIKINDLPKFIKRAKKLNLMYNIRFVGDGKALILGLYPFKDSQTTLPTKPTNLGDPRVKEFYAFLYAFMPGPVECFTNGMAPNEQNILKLKEFGYSLEFNNEDLALYIKDWIDSHHAQFDPELILNDFNYRMYHRQHKLQELVSSFVATACKLNPFK